MRARWRREVAREVADRAFAAGASAPLVVVQRDVAEAFGMVGLPNTVVVDEIQGPTCVSFAPQVIADGSGKFCGNALRFATPEEAQANAKDLMWRWLLVRETRVVPTLDPVNYRWTEQGLEEVLDGKA